MNIATFKSKFHWEKNIARCGTCKHCKLPSTVLVGDRLIKTKPFCNAGMFYTRINAVCDNWTDRNGATLEP